MRKFVYQFAMLSLLFFVGLWPTSIEAANSVTATKTCGAGGTTTTLASFTLATPQVIAWSATYNPVPGCNGDAFYLSTVGPNMADIALTTAGQASGTQFLNAGTYHISINTFLMGQGSYKVTYNQTASIGVTPLNHPFGNLLTGESSPAPGFQFTISSTGDLPVTISSVVSSDPAHFVVTSAPIGDQVPPNRTFRVRFQAGSTPGTWAANITVSGTSALGAVTPVTVTVNGTTLPREPDISCSGNPNLGSADWFTGEVRIFNRSFQNTGTEQLTLTSIQLINDSPGSPFSLSGTPSLAPVAAEGGSRLVAIQFAPPFAGGEAMYSGHLVIHSNDPDEPVMQCFFTATAHHPVPIMRLESNVLNYREVELGFAFKKAIVVYNDGDAPLTVTVSDISTGDPMFEPNLMHWSSLEIGGPRTVAVGTTPEIFEEVYEPLALGAHTIRLRVSGNDLTNPSQNVTLTGEGISPIPIDNVLVLDRSFSMNESAGPRRKIDALQTAADMYLHLLREETGSGTGDKIGFVRYNQDNDVYLTLDFIGSAGAPATHLAEAENKVSPAAIADPGRLLPAGNTGIGGAMQTAAGMLLGSPADRKHVMVVLTDGQENVDPRILDVIGPVRAADSNLKMYSVGLGSLIEPDKLQAITNVGNGYHQVTDDLNGTSRYDLETFYFKIFSNASEMDLVVDPTTPVLVSGANSVIVNTARIVSSDRSATFLVLDEPYLRAFYNLELVDPSGQIIVLGTTVGGIPVHQLQRYNYTIYRVIFPEVALAPSYVGDWVLRLTPNGRWSPTVVRDSLANRKQTDYINPYQGLVPIGFATAVKSNYRLAVSVLPSSYLPGANVKLTASLSDRGWPSVTGEVFVDATTPSNTVYPGIRLYDDGTHGDAVSADGTWTNHFLQTGESGSYKFFFHAVGENERGELAPREATRYLTLMQPSRDPHPSDKPCIPCLLQWLLWLMLIGLLIWIIVRCCKR